MLCPKRRVYADLLNCEKEKNSPHRYNAPTTMIQPNAPSTPLIPKVFPDSAELVCTLALAVLDDDPADVSP
jgi:hypothetical protein